MGSRIVEDLCERLVQLDGRKRLSQKVSDVVGPQLATAWSDFNHLEPFVFVLLRRIDQQEMHPLQNLC